MIQCGDAITILQNMESESIHCCVTSPPYFGLRDYGIVGQLGLESTPQEYVDKMVVVFAEVRRVLRKDGTLWLNLGDTYAASGRGWGGGSISEARSQHEISGHKGKSRKPPLGFKEKDLIGIPWITAKALQAPRYIGRIAVERDRVWLAAIMDGEGSICGFTHQRKDNGQVRRGIHLTVTNSNTLMLDECFRIWKTSRQQHNTHGRGHFGKLDTFRWIAHGMREKAQLLAELYPYFVCKKKQALLAWNFLQINSNTRGRNKGIEGDENREKSAWIVSFLSKLNHLESIDIPDWIAEPPSMYEPGWYLRQDIIWSKTACMPESVTDRCTRSHEYIFMLTKSKKYFYDAAAIAEPQRGHSRRHAGFNDRWDNMEKEEQCSAMRNKRSVWRIGPQPFSEAHFAVFPEKLVEPCIFAGCPHGGIVLDPFCGSGTTGIVALKSGRQFVGIELNPEYVKMAERRIYNECPMGMGLMQCKK